MKGTLQKEEEDLGLDSGMLFRKLLRYTGFPWLAAYAACGNKPPTACSLLQLPVGSFPWHPLLSQAMVPPAEEPLFSISEGLFLTKSISMAPQHFPHLWWGQKGLHPLQWGQETWQGGVVSLGMVLWGLLLPWCSVSRPWSSGCAPLLLFLYSLTSSWLLGSNSVTPIPGDH